ncbi:MAG TPA: phenylalanine--tRNA ligase subunit alpha [Candidatus Protoclostridium stercorigallinarum]|uniref:Phenylalanine--tRNA ligase alpha subunit n=1 Tax=Candidatus Protoclostridium stercorigallinarum TaxID=2838741 RepID=A0A9D1Q1C4_9FIRM|nr:phenylalanine--tRNA ligase subunit alpha [Candidatus Protoclostridium stercorigallinarum]
MEEKIGQLTRDCGEEIAAAGSENALYAVRVKYLGKSGLISDLMKGMKDLAPEQRPVMGKLVNDARGTLEALFAAKGKELHDAELAARLAAEKIDITAGEDKLTGKLHPLNAVRRRLVDFFVSMGFDVMDGPEVETDYYNFEALNVPKDHPARDMQDTFFLGGNLLLRSQTSASQVRYMEDHKPPLKMISPGRVFRNDDDATHSPVFHQLEGLVVDKGITMCDLKGILDSFAKHFFGKDTKVRFRPSYFPFTEPSVEVDVSCSMCHGKGCKICKGTGWIEILGAGIVNRKVLRICGIDPDEYTGFAFGFGIDRIANIIHSIPHIKLLYENDIRFLEQF